MQQKSVAKAVDCSLQDICSSAKLFGGITTVFCGDWRQCLPVLPRKGRADIVNECLSSCTEIWSHVTVLHLRRNMWLEASPEDQKFAEWLLQVDNGQHADTDCTIEPQDALIVETRNAVSYTRYRTSIEHYSHVTSNGTPHLICAYSSLQHSD
jgi:hypothetical protein